MNDSVNVTKRDFFKFLDILIYKIFKYITNYSKIVYFLILNIY